MMRVNMTLLLGLSMALALGGAVAADPPPAGRAMYEAVDITPMPKRIRLTGRSLRFSPVTLVTGERPCRQTTLGADWIKARVIELGGAAPKVVKESAAPAGGLRVFIGVAGSCAAVDRGAREGRYRLGKDAPGRNGYVIEPVPRGASADLLLGGADPVGALYACVTLAGLLERRDGGVFLREADIVDWPDFALCSLSRNLRFPEYDQTLRRFMSRPTDAKARQAYVAQAKREMDRLLKWKVSSFYLMKSRNFDRLRDEHMPVVKEVCDYGRERGVHTLIYALRPMAGFCKDFPNTPKRCLTNIGRPRYKGMLRCWSMDAERRPTARRMAERIRASGVTDVGFHDWDTGAFMNPANWESRCDVCRKRWGDDFAAATINKHRIYYEEIKRLNPDVRLHFTLYPYNIAILTQKTAERYLIGRYGPSPSIPQSAAQLRRRYTDFWRRVAKGIPGEATFCIREALPENVRIFHELSAPHGTFIWYLSGMKVWQTFYDVTPSWAPTFYSGRGDVMFTVCLQRMLPIKGLAVREYTWNVKAPGAGEWNMPNQSWGKRPMDGLQQHADPVGDVYKVILPHVCRVYFGRRAGPAMTRALSLNMSYGQIFIEQDGINKRKVRLLADSKAMFEQADRADEGARVLDELFEKVRRSRDGLGMDVRTRRRFLHVRDVFHSCRWMARVKGQEMLARELAKKGKLPDARAALARAETVLAEALPALKRLMAQRLPDPLYNAGPDRRGRLPYWKATFMPDNPKPFLAMGKALKRTGPELEGLAASDELPYEARKGLGRRSRVHAPAALGEIVIDGKLDEADWARPYPAEAFLIHQTGQLARADTRVSLLRGKDRLYVGVRAWMPKGASIKTQARKDEIKVHEDEGFEMFVAAPGMKGGYAHLRVNPSGSVYDQRITFIRKTGGLAVRKRDLKWKAKGVQVATGRFEGGWTAELALPLQTLGLRRWRGSWRLNLARDCRIGGRRELSSIQRPGGKSFHDVKTWPVMDSLDREAPPPVVGVGVDRFASRPMTLDDRVATMCRFGVEVRSDRLLHNFRLTAELYDAKGKLHRRAELAKGERLPLYWRSEEPVELGFEKLVEAGGVRVRLESAEATAETWARVGDFRGAGDLGALFDGKEGLADRCVLASRLTQSGKADPPSVFDGTRGCLELSFKQTWKGVERLFSIVRPMGSNGTLFHFGPVRLDYPYHSNKSSLTVMVGSRGAYLHAALRTRAYGSYSVYAPLGDKQGWRRVAVAWELDGPPEKALRLYLDGKLVSKKTSFGPKSRLKGRGKRLDTKPYPIQIGSMTSGRWPARATIRDVRISRVPRYTGAAAEGDLGFDERTSVWLPLRGALTGKARLPDGRPVDLRAVPGWTGGK